jgi:hypothetical protein
MLSVHLRLGLPSGLYEHHLHIKNKAIRVTDRGGPKCVSCEV